ncbi:MAG: RloB family protein [Victivallales bacterium]|jgi:hypothetical protein|nr:RloB family protein [Victivallales bacterium]
MSRRERTKTKKQPKPTFRIYIEDKKSGCQYIRDYLHIGRDYHGDLIQVTHPSSHSPEGLLKVAESGQIGGLDEDETWIVFDHDGHNILENGRKNVPQVFKRAGNAKIKIAFSSISFETWILMHFWVSLKTGLR